MPDKRKDNQEDKIHVSTSGLIISTMPQKSPEANDFALTIFTFFKELMPKADIEVSVTTSSNEKEYHGVTVTVNGKQLHLTIDYDMEYNELVALSLNCMKN